MALNEEGGSSISLSEFAGYGQPDGSGAYHLRRGEDISRSFLMDSDERFWNSYDMSEIGSEWG